MVVYHHFLTVHLLYTVKLAQNLFAHPVGVDSHVQ